MATVSLVNLVDSLLQKAYHDLTVLQELLRNKSDGDRKVEIVKYAQKTRALLIRLLALVKWASNSSSVKKCSDMSLMLSQQSGLYVDTADQLVQLVRSTLINACTPNFSLAQAVDVLSTGTYPRLPTCIKDRIIPLPLLKPEEERYAYSLIDCAIRRRLLRENIPEAMVVTNIGRGVISFKVPYEFELTLSVVSDDLSTPWRLISLKILVSEALPDKPVLLQEQQKLYLHQLIQSRLYSEDRPLQDCYECIHSFCLALQLDCLHSQVNQLSSDIYGGYLKVEEYCHDHHLRIMYWRPGTSQFMSAFLLDQSRTSSWPKILVSINSSSQSPRPFSTQHFPPLPPGVEVTISANNLSLESLLKKCIQVRSHNLLSNIRAVLKDTPWEKRTELCEVPLCLNIKVPLKYGTGCVILGVDTRVGNIVASVDPPCPVGGVPACLEELERVVTSTWSKLLAQLSKLQSHLFIGHIAEIAKELHLPVHWSLPLVNPLPFHTSAMLYLELLPHTYLVVSVVEGLLDQYHLLTLTPSSFGSLLVQSPSTSVPPKSFFTISSLVQLNQHEITLQHIRTVMVRRKGPHLKRKLKECSFELPCLKRICVGEGMDFSPLPGITTARMILLSMETSLNAAGISHYTTYTEFGSLCANIFNFPLDSSDMHELLSSLLQSCQVTHSSSGYSCTFVFSPLDLGGKTGAQQDVILTQSIAPPTKEPDCSDLGQTLLGQWHARVTLLGLTLELRQYLDDAHWPIHSLCTISEFTFDLLSVMFGKHTLHVKATPIGLSLGLSSDCPHSLVQGGLEEFLQQTQSLPLLLQGICITEKSMSLLAAFTRRLPVATVSATSPSQIQLNYDNNFSISLNLQTNSTVTLTDIRYNKPSGVPVLQINPLSYLQAFLRSTFSSSSDSEEVREDSDVIPNSNVQKLSLYPIPSPISFPPRISGPDLVPSPHGFSIPSIPPFPSPIVGSGMGQGSSWNYQLSLEQFSQLLSPTPSQPVKPDTCVVGCSLLESFLGSLSLLFHGIQLANKPFNLIFVQCDRGVYTYRTDNLAITFSMEGGVLRGSLKPIRDNVWSSAEVATLVELFKKEVVNLPFSTHTIQSFYTLLVLPLPVSKSCVQLLQHQQTALNPNGLIWNFSLYLTIPPEADLSGTPFYKGGAAIIYGRAKLLLFLRFERIQDKESFILPLMYDPKTNITYVARFQNQYRNSMHPHIDSILRKASNDFMSGQAHIPGHLSSSLYPAVLSLAQTPLNI